MERYYQQQPQAGAGGGKSSMGIIIALGLGLSVSAAIAWYVMSQQKQQQQSTSAYTEVLNQLQQARLQQAQSQQSSATLPPPTEPPLCPDTYAPVIDRYGKVYKNVCEADSVGAQYAPTPFDGGATPSVATNSTLAALLSRLPASSNSRTSLGTAAPITINQGGQTISGRSLQQQQQQQRRRLN